MIQKVFSFVLKSTILWHAGEQSLHFVKENCLKLTQLFHQMHIPTDWYKQIKLTKKKEKKNKDNCKSRQPLGED